MEETDQRPVLSQLRRTLFKQIVNNEFHSLRYCGLQSVTLSWLADYGRLQFIQRFVRGQIDSKIRSYLTACLITSVSRDILFYCLLCVCVYVCLCVIVLIQPWLPKHGKCYVMLPKKKKMELSWAQHCEARIIVGTTVP